MEKHVLVIVPKISLKLFILFLLNKKKDNFINIYCLRFTRKENVK